MAAHPMTDVYRNEREALLALGDTITAAESARMTTACPEWSVKDVYAHLAGISADILDGNTEDAATAAWADQHVADRQEASLAQVLAEWRAKGSEVSKVMASFGDAFPYQLFIDQFTHEWDIRAALGERAAAAPNLAIWHHFADNIRTSLSNDDSAHGLGRITLDLYDGAKTWSVALGSEAELGTTTVPLFEFARAILGRRSLAQASAFDWPIADPTEHVLALVRFGISPIDIDDPVRIDG